MAQVGGLVMLQPEVGGSRDGFFFVGMDKVRFRKPVIAGDTLVMRMTLTKLQKRFGIAKMVRWYARSKLKSYNIKAMDFFMFFRPREDHSSGQFAGKIHYITTRNQA
ncbi:hypothetical protein RJ639_037925 [Escallonia herrerae]|uniref:Uncharacterized protein n=1 Tax=Escallonia herrerae TaxID=1293975 RepID=A0AA89B7Q3_9ASTE|nr:hypothetical protein RJ639_037925 [Escallonia herrerae]